MATKRRTTSSSTSGRKKTTKKSASARRSTPKRGATSASSRRKKSSGNSLSGDDKFLIFMLVSFCVLLVIFLCMIGLISGAFGPALKVFFSGLLGIMAYILPVVLMGYIIYRALFIENRIPLVKKIGSVAFLVFFGMMAAFVSKTPFDTMADMTEGKLSLLYQAGKGGGVLFGMLAFCFYKIFGTVGSIILLILLMIISLALLLGPDFFIYLGYVKDFLFTRDTVTEDDYSEDERREALERRRRRLEERKLRNEEKRALKEEKALEREEARERWAEKKRQSQESDGFNSPDDEIIQAEENIRAQAEAARRKEEAERRREEAENKRREQQLKKEQAEDAAILAGSMRKNKEKDKKKSVTFVSPGKLDDIHEITIIANPTGFKNDSVDLMPIGMNGSGELGDITEISAADIHAVPNPLDLPNTDTSTALNDTLSANTPTVSNKKETEAPLIIKVNEDLLQKNESSDSFSISEIIADEDVKIISSEVTEPNKAGESLFAEKNDNSKADEIDIADPAETLSDNKIEESENRSDNDSEKVASLDDISEEKDSNKIVFSTEERLSEPAETENDALSDKLEVKADPATDDKTDEKIDAPEPLQDMRAFLPPDLSGMPTPVTERTHQQENKEPEKNENDSSDSDSSETVKKDTPAKPVKKKKAYTVPPVSLLEVNEKNKGGDTDESLKETAMLLQDTLKNFGVKATVEHISQGPSVTRFELKPEAGTKVNKILNLTDDIKLNLAAQDVRIEAPIPGKAAVGIEIPNKEKIPVLIRDLIDSKDYKSSQANLTYAVGKDITGKIIVSDIAKMPHLLVAGSTGSGKSVFINTLILSLLYKSSPEDVKLIMIDPKVVELSVYNGIPHLLLPVVSDPRQANAALAWAVAEMMRRYKAFSDFSVRDMRGYNEKAEGNGVEKLPHIVIIVDELADLMMVAQKDVEASICRLTQLARAAGIHLIIATQRPSVDVITGLIKANMPSRLAFRVSSGVDSRTILDTVGAERLLGNGDMLFHPQSFNKPLRVQGAFVSDDEVMRVVEFLKKNAGDDVYDNEVAEKISSMANSESSASASSDGAATDSGKDYDTYFADACRFVVEKQKASASMLQRVFKVGYNRAARMVDQMEEAGVIGSEEGTNPRKVLMDKSTLEDFLSNI